MTKRRVLAFKISSANRKSSLNDTVEMQRKNIWTRTKIIRNEIESLISFHFHDEIRELVGTIQQELVWRLRRNAHYVSGGQLLPHAPLNCAVTQLMRLH